MNAPQLNASTSLPPRVLITLVLSLLLSATPAVARVIAPPRFSLAAEQSGAGREPRATSVVIRGLTRITADLEAIVRANSRTPLADKAEDSLDKVRRAIAKLRQRPPDRQGGLGELESAAGDLEAAVKDDLLRPSVGNRLLNRIAGAARQLAVHALSEAATPGGKSSKIADAEQALAAGDRDRAALRYMDAVAKYRDALSKAEGA
jgi:hypothetical protein